MNDVVYRITESKDGILELVTRFMDELPNGAIYYNNSGKCLEKVIVGRKVYEIILHSSLFRNDRDSLDRLTKKQLKLFYNISKNKLK